ncbi:carbon-nitrogen hydrolase family protein [Dietzia sp. 179-F 9C3 NHS]|uniref:carbon-nitrogen hydrolase family protein n=1 Tax=Dietzia sp. 179-F 9C3 NHS TaxID=3374295 RepID=UPI0038798B79
MRIAAVQFEGVPGDVAENLGRLGPLVAEAVDTGAEVIALPEFCTSPVVFRPEVHRAVLPPENTALEMLRDVAQRHGVMIGGSLLVADGDEVYNRYHLVEPDGAVHTHDKDLPTMWENAFYGPGRDDGVVSTGTAAGRVGLAVCWELIRNRTARRMLGRVDLVLSGTHWWTVPTNWGPVDRVLGGVAQYNRYLSENAPAELARRLGVPVVQASHCGEFTTGFGLVPGVRVAPPYRTHFVGATQIVDADGRVLAWRSTEDGPGVVVADVEVGARAPRQPIARRFWTPDLPWAIRAYWWQQNAFARRYYRARGRAAGLAAAARES